MNLSPPSSQKAGARPISFALDGGGPLSFVDLVVRPEDLTRVDPSRLSVQQTLGPSAWVDNFGAGLARITISGHTGWRRIEGVQGDGLERFIDLKDRVFTHWHSRRNAQASAGMDPDAVRLIFSDALDGFSEIVAPDNFTLRRSKSRPLLAQYQISLTVVSENGKTGYLDFGGLLGGGATEALGLDSLTASVNRITDMLGKVKGFINGTLLGPVTKFMQQTARLYAAVRGAISAGSDIAGALIGVARATAQAGINIFRTLAAVASIPSLVRNQLMQVAGAYSNILCVLGNALKQKRFIQDYSDLYGSSNCSSTAGGRPLSSLAGQNPFYTVVPTRQPLPVAVSVPAQQSLAALGGSDTVLAPMSMSALNVHVGTIASGMVVA